MRCIFCKIQSDGSKSVEHIVPESLGNRSHTLPPGIVCDACNNYFARKVEKPVLESGHFRVLRFAQAVPNKRKRIPKQVAVILPDIPVRIIRNSDGNTTVDVPTQYWQEISNSKRNQLVLPVDGPLPEEKLMSRFLGKMALETMAQKALKAELSTDYLVDETQLDPIRNWARRGYPEPSWPFHRRTIYQPNCSHTSNEGEKFQVIFEYDIFATEKSEFYFCLAVFGVEYTINIGGPDLDGYIEWLSAHNNASPLYIPKSPV